MSADGLSRPLRGIVPPMVTPLLDPDTLDVEGLERLLQHLIDGGVHGLFVLGTTGEAPSLSYHLRREVIQRVCRHIGHGLPVLVGVTDTSIAESLELARCAADAGAAAVVAAPPYYFPLDQAELFRYMRGLAARLPLPLMLYNMPAVTKLSFEPETVRRLLDEPRIVGLKDSSRQMDYFLTVREVTRARPDWSLLVGFEHMLVETLRAGGDGGVLGGANLSPRLLVELYDVARSGDAARLARVEERLAVHRRIYSLDRGTLASVRGIKCGLALRGICRETMAPPFVGLDHAHWAQAEAILAELDALGPV